MFSGLAVYREEAPDQGVRVDGLDLIARRECRAIVGREVTFNEIPAALEALENRTTVGRTVAHVR
jgi:hypothetical protein